MGYSYGQQAYAQATGTASTFVSWIDTRDPTPNDINYQIGSFWQNTQSIALWYLNSKTSVEGFVQANWELISKSGILLSLSGSSNPSTPVYPSTSTSTPPDNILLTNLDGSMTITGDPTNHQVIFSAISSPSLPWTDEGSDFNAVAYNGYMITATCTATLPSSPSQGNTIAFAVDSSGVLTIQASSGQTIKIGTGTSSSGGTATNTFIGDSIILVYRALAQVWIAVPAPEGSWILT